ncbi:MAG TPA: Ig-like domain-containing protein, partial [Allosphingosinicella sp.]
ASDSATLTVTVDGGNDAPVANDDAVSTGEDSIVSGNVLANDTDLDGEALTMTSPGTYVGSYGTLNLAADGSYTYTPNAAAQGLDDGETAIDVFSYAASDGTASDTATLTVTVSGANDAPVANDDSVATDEDNAISGNVLTNDTDVDGEALSVTNPGTYNGTYGTLILAADGSYTYTPNAAAQALDTGDSVQDVFTYAASDGTASDSATLTVTINGANDGPQTVWYIDNSAVGSTNVGTQANPFTSIASFNAAQGAADGPQDGATVYLLQGTGTYAEADGLNLLDDQILIGVGQPTVAPLAGNGIDLADNNNVSGIDINVAAGNVGIEDDGSSVGNLVISDVAIAGAGQIVDLDTGGTLDVSLNSATSTGSTGGAIDLAGVGGNFTVTGATTITGLHSGGGIDITGSSVVATFAGGGNVATLNTVAVNYAGNTGALAIGGGFDILTTSGAGLNASGGGTVTVTGAGNSIASTSGTALNVSNTDIGLAGLTFESISSNGATSGIILNSTGTTAGVHGGLTVTGDGGSALNGSGGTIAGSTGAGISLSNTRDVSLDQVTVQNGLDDGVRGNNVTNFTLTNAAVTNNGNALQEHGGDFTNLLGTGTFTNVTFSNNEASQVSIVNTSGTSNLAFTAVTMSSNGVAAAPNGLHGLNVAVQGTASADLLVVDSAFDNLFSNSINAANSGSGTLEVEIAGTDFTNVGASAINIVQSSSGTVRFNIHDNDTFLRGTNSGVSHSININQASTVPAGAVLEGAISNNTIGDNSSSSSATAGGDGIRIFSVGAGTTTVRIDGNDIQGVGGNGINVQMSGSNNAAHTLNATIFGNEVVLTAAGSLDAIRVVAGAATGNAGILRLDMHDNDASSSFGNDFQVRQRFATTVQLLDYLGAPTDTTAVQNYFDNDRANDAIGPGTDWFITTQTPGGGFVGTGSVPQPTLPIISDLPLL